MERRRRRIKGPWPVWKLVLADILALGLALLVFALFHHAIPRRQEAVGIVSERVSSTSVVQETVEAVEIAVSEPVNSAMPEPENNAVDMQEMQPAATPEPVVDPVGYFGTKFADKFTAGEVIREARTYQSENVNVSITQVHEKDTDIYIADIYVKDIGCLQAALGQDTYGRGYTEHAQAIANRKGAVITLNGDYYGARNNGVVIRNGVLYREDPTLDCDVGVLYWDGTMKCFSPREFDAQKEIERGAYQAWSFGPMLLDKDGNTMEKFNSKVNPRNPRAALGYYEPGHYCMVAVDGRTEQSAGLSLAQMSALMNYLGCKAAYNLDGGQTAVMVYGNEVVNKPVDNGRPCSDFIMVMDVSGTAERG